MKTYLELDRRRRAALARIAQHDSYMVTVGEHGIITFTPATVVTDVERELWRTNPELAQEIEDEANNPTDWKDSVEVDWRG